MDEVLDKLNPSQDVLECISIISQKYSNFVFPVIPVDLINSVKKNYNESHNILKAIAELDQYLKFDTTIVECAMESMNGKIKFNEFCLVYSILSFIYRTETQHWSSYIGYIFTAFKVFYQTTNSTLLYQLYEITSHVVIQQTNYCEDENVSREILKSSPNDYKLGFKALVELLNCTWNNKHIKTSYQVMERLQKYIVDARNDNYDLDDRCLIDFISTVIYTLDSNILKLAGCLSLQEKFEPTQRIYSVLPSSIIEFLYHNEFSFSHEALETQQSQQSPEINTTVDDLISPFASKISSNVRFDEVLPALVLDKYEEIIGLLFTSSEKFCDVFFKNFCDRIQTERYDNMFTLAYFATKITISTHVPNSVFEKLFKSIFFDPEINIYKEYKNFNIISFIRNSTINLINEKNKRCFEDLFVIYKDYPLAVSEISLRIFKLGIQPFPVMYSDTIFSIIISSYKSINEMPVNSSTVCARTSLFLYMLNLLGNEIPDSSFSSPFFVTAYIPFYSESFFNDIIFHRIKSIMSSQFSSSVCQFIASTIQVLIHKNDSNETIAKLIRNFSDSVVSKVHSTNDLTMLIDVSKSALMMNPSETMLSAFLQLSLQLSIISDMELSYQTCADLSKIIGGSISDANMMKLVCIMSKNLLTRIDFHFLIKAPQIMILLLSIYSQMGRASELLRTVSNLALKSCFNSKKLQSAEFDLLLLDMIYNFPNDFTFRGCFIRNFTKLEEIDENIFPLLHILSSNISSPVVVQRMLKIIHPDKDPLVRDFFASKFIQLVKPDIKASRFVIPISSQTKYFTMNGMSRSNLLNMTISFWLYVDEELSSMVTKNVNIFSATADNCQCNLLYLNGSQMFLIVRTPGSANEITVVEEIIPSRWNLYQITIKTINGETTVETQINERYPLSTTFYTKYPGESPVLLSFGNTNDQPAMKNDEIEAVYQIAWFVIYDRVLTQSEKDSFVNAGILATEKFEPLCEVSPCFFKGVEPTEHLISLSERYPNLNYVISHQFPIEFIVPFFSRLETQIYTTTIFDIFHICFGNKFRTVFEVLPHYLLQNEPLSRNLNLYKKFLQLSENLDDNKDIFSLVDNILMNCDLWIESQDINSIVKQWIQLYTMYPFIAERSDEGCKIVYITMSYFLSEEISTKRYDKINVERCQDILLSILQTCRIDKDSMKDIISEMSHCKEQKLFEKFFMLLPKIMNNDNITHECLAELYHGDALNASESIGVFLRVANIIDSENFLLFSYLFAEKIQQISLDLIYPLMHEMPQVTNIMFMCAIRSSHEIQAKFVPVIKTFMIDKRVINALKTERTWLMWPTIFAMHLDESIRFKACEMIARLISINLDIDDIEFVIGLCLIIRATTKLPVDSILPTIMKLICDFELSKVTFSEHPTQILPLAFISEFAKIGLSYYSVEIIEALNASPFIDEPINAGVRWESILTMENLLMAVNNKFIPIFSFIKKENMNQDQQGLLLSLNNIIAYWPKGYNFEDNFVADLLEGKITDKGVSFITSKVKLIVSNTQSEILSLSRRIESEREIIANQNYYFEDQQMNNYIFRNNKGVNILRKINRDYITERSLFKSTTEPEFGKDSIATIDGVSIRMKRLARTNKILMKKEFSIDKNFVLETKCKRIKIKCESEEIFYLYKDRFVLINDYKRREVKLNDIIRAVSHCRALEPTCIEFYLYSTSILLEFPSKSIQSNIFNLLSTEITKPLDPEDLLAKWNRNEMSNFELLSQLNIAARRSFNDPENYPFFPWVIIDYSSPHFDLENPSEFRSLSLPLSCATSESRKRYASKMKSKGSQVDRYVFGQYFSNPSIITFFMKHIEPFSTLNQRLFGTSDAPTLKFVDMFTLLERMLRSDAYREAVPEFYSMLDIFKGSQFVHPPWAKSNEEFVYLNRRALECAYVTEHLNEWINLAYGVWRHGEEAEKHFNTFIGLIDYDFLKPQKRWPLDQGDQTEKLGEIEDTTEMSEIVKSMTSSLGTVPPSLFPKFVYPKEVYSFSMEGGTEKISIGYDIILSLSLNQYIFNINSSNSVYIIKCNQKIETKRIIKLPFDVSSRSPFVPRNDSVVVGSSDGNRSAVISPNGELELLHIPFDFIIGCGNTTAFVLRGGCVRFLSQKGVSILVVPFEDIMAAAGSDSVDAFACVSADGFVSVYSISKLRIINETKVIDAEGPIRHVRLFLTPSLRLLTVYVGGEAFVLTVNANLVRRSQLPIKAKVIGSISDGAGIDYTVCVTGKVLLFFEAFYPENISQPVRLASGIVSAGVVSRNGGKYISVVTSNGSLTLIPWILHE